jgi:hypothetical protein
VKISAGRVFSICLVSLSWCGAPVFAQAPAGARGKSVTATWTETRLQRVGGIGDFSEKSFSQSLSAYISSEGRVFAKRTVSSAGRRGRSKTGEASSVGEKTEAGGAGQAGTFRGGSLVVTTQFAGGARLAKIDFDASFSSCTATVILGRERGQIARGRVLATGEALEIKSASVSNTSCSVSVGNVFGN